MLNLTQKYALIYITSLKRSVRRVILTTFGKNFKQFRKKLGLSQEEISEKLGVTSQAVSKWECDRSYPNLEVLLSIAELFDISLDMLLRGREKTEEGYKVNDGAQQILGLPDDETLRIVLCKGNKLLRYEEGCNGLKVPLKINGKIGKLEVRGSATIDGDVFGSITASASVGCNNVDGNITAGASVSCDNVTGNVASGLSFSGDNVYGDVSAGGNVGCDNIHGDVQCGGDISCDNITGNIVKCEKVVYINRES